MLPLKLEMHAFSCYPGIQCLDFRELGSRSLFLVHGPTGSGKTTILDAMSFALYGESTNPEREAKQLRSQFAESELPTKVVFDFALGNRKFRVERWPEQPLKRKRGDGDKTAGVKAFLWDRTECENDKDEGRVCCTKAREVTSKIEELLGCKVEQFRQLIIIPQGQFRQFLSGDVKDRKSILETLFRTEYYRRIEFALRDASGRAEAALTQAMAKNRTVLEHHSAASMEELERKLTSTSEALAALQITEKGLRADVAAAEEKLQAAGLFFERFQELDSAEDEEKAASEERPLYEAHKNILLAAKKALPLGHSWSLLEEDREELKRAEEALAKVAAAARTAEATLETAAVTLGCEAERREAIRGMEEKLLRGRDLLPKVRRLSEERGRWEIARASHETAEKALELFLEEGNEQKKRLAALNSSIEKYQKLSSQKEALILRIEQARAVLGKVHSLEQVRKRLELLAEDAAFAAVALEIEEKKLELAETELEEARERQLGGSAALLANSLREGEPCPVCGSTSHPAPAGRNEAAEARDDIQRLVGAAVSQKETVAAAHKVAAEAAQLIAAERAREASLCSELPQRVPLEKELEKDLSELERSLAISEAAEKRRGEAERERFAIEKFLGEADEKLKLERDRITELARAAAESAAAVSELERDMPATDVSCQYLENSIASLESAIVSAGKCFEDETRAFHEAALALSKVKGQLAEKEIAKIQRAEALLERNRSFEQDIREVGFHDVEAFLSARRTAAEIEDLEQSVAQYEQRVRSAQDRLKRARDGIAGLPRPDVTALTLAKEKAEEAFHAHNTEKGRLEAESKALGNAKRALEEGIREIERLEKEYQLAEVVSGLAVGRNSARMSFNAFILATFFDDVIVAATERLRRMSKNRYELCRNTAVGDRRSEAGLELLVTDNYAGMARPTSTLSGGEGFITALALALGLSDVVQAHSGGIRMDAIFIDEGFGSLDPDALDLAYQTLYDLQKSGRLIGIISHVPELRERIDVRLEVTGGKTGSSARFIVP